MDHILQSLLCDNNVQPKGTEIELCDNNVQPKGTEIELCDNNVQPKGTEIELPSRVCVRVSGRGAGEGGRDRQTLRQNLTQVYIYILNRNR